MVPAIGQGWNPMVGFPDQTNHYQGNIQVRRIMKTVTKNRFRRFVQLPTALLLLALGVGFASVGQAEEHSFDGYHSPATRGL